MTTPVRPSEFPRTATDSWHHFPEASRASAAALSAFFTAATDLEADAILVKVWSESRPNPRLAVAKGVSREVAERIDLALRQVDGEVLDRRAKILIGCLSTDPRTAGEVWVACGLERMLAVPMIFGDRPLGILYVLDTGGHAYSSDRLELIAEVAEEAAAAVARVRIEYAETRRLVDREIGRTIGTIAGGGEDLPELARSLVEHLVPMTGARRGGVMLVEDGWLQLLAGGFGATPEQAASYRIHVDDPDCAAEVFRTRQPRWSNDPANDSSFAREWIELFGISRILSVPLGEPSRRPWGVLHLADKPSDFDADDVHRVDLAASHLASSFSLARATAELGRSRRIEMILCDLAADIASANPLTRALATAFDRIRAASGRDLLLLRAGGRTVSSPRGRTDPGRSGSAQARFLDDLAGRMSGGHIEQPQAAGDPGAAWWTHDVVAGGHRFARFGVFQAQARPFGDAERRWLERLCQLASLGLQADRFQAQQLQLVRMNERQSIADQLHDHLAQLLFMASANVEAVLLGSADDPPAPLTQAHRQLREGERAIRSALEDLTAPVGEPLLPRVTAVCEQLREELPLAVSTRISGSGAWQHAEPSPEAADVLVRVVREALINVHKHAGPCQVEVGLLVDAEAETVELTVWDDGRGPVDGCFNDGYGLSSLRRAVTAEGGKFAVQPRRPQGTRVSCSLPLRPASR